MPPRFTRNSDRPRASDRTMVDTEDTRTRLPSFQTRDWRCHHRQMNPQGIANKPEQNLSIESGGTLTAVGWTSRHKIFSPPVEAELFFLTSLFIELTEMSLMRTVKSQNHPTFDKARER